MYDDDDGISLEKKDFAQVRSIDIFIKYCNFKTSIPNFFDEYLDPKTVKTIHPVMEEEHLFLPDLGKGVKNPRIAENLTKEKLIKHGWRMGTPKTIADLWYSLGTSVNVTRPLG